MAARGRTHATASGGALLARFVQDGAVDYGTMTRVRRLVEVYLQRLADADPDVFRLRRSACFLSQRLQCHRHPPDFAALSR